MMRLLKKAIEGKESGFLSGLIVLPLWPFSLIYRFLVALRSLLYAKGALLKKELPCKVICVGNLTTGGTGKTPAVIKIAGMFQAMGKKVAVISRGYGGSYNGVKVIDPGRDNATDVGDEPLLMARQLKGIPVVVSRDRHAGGMNLCSSKRFDIIILDDGFQHLRLKRDLDIVLIDANLPFGNGHLLPMGILREPLNALKRADAFILTRVDISSNINNLCSLITRLNPKAPIFKSSHRPVGLKVLEDGALRDETAGFIKGKKIIAFAGIANPDSFFDMITGMGGVISNKISFRDHMAFSAKDLELLDSSAGEGKILMTTEKDLARINHFNFRSPLAVLKIELSLEREDELNRFLAGHL